MFRKLVTNLSFSPSLISELGPYNLRLKHEELRRAAGLFFLVLALIVQTLAASFPPESANAANENDIIYGGITSLDELLTKYDHNEQNLQDIYTSLGITRGELQQLEHRAIRPSGDYFVAGRTPRVSAALGEVPYQFAKESGGLGTIYLAPADQLDAAVHSYTYKMYDALVGTSSRAGSFAVITASGNVALRQLPRTDTSQAEPQPITYIKSATNTTKNQLATDTIAHASDRIVYTIRAKNTSQQTVDVAFSDNLADVLEYANLLETNGGTYNETTKTISWPDTPIMAGQTTSRSFSVRVNSHISATAQGLGNPMSYDCSMSNTITNTVAIRVACPAPKFIETITTELPQTPAPTSFAAGILLLVVATYLYFRARQQREELRLIRKDINAGTV